jgi:transaldolase
MHSLIKILIKELPDATEVQIADQRVRESSIQSAGVLKPIVCAQRCKTAGPSIQTDPRLFRDARSIVEPAVEFRELAENLIVKGPATSAGVLAIEHLSSTNPG